jgi:hypothetical protein
VATSGTPPCLKIGVALRDEVAIAGLRTHLDKFEAISFERNKVEQQLQWLIC